MAFSRVDSLTTLNELNSPIIHNGFLYVAARYGVDSWIVKVNLSTFAVSTYINIARRQFLSPEGAVLLDSANNNLYYLGKAHTGQGAICKVSTTPTFAYVDSVLPFESTTTPICTAQIDSVNGYLYFGTYGSPAYLGRLNLSDFSVSGITSTNLTDISLITGNSYSTLDSSLGSLIDVAAGKVFFFAWDNFSLPHALEFSLSDFSLGNAFVQAHELEYIESGAPTMFNSGKTFVYIPEYNDPGTITRYNYPAWTKESQLVLPAGDGPFWKGSTIGSTYGYFATDTAPTEIIRVKLSDFTRHDKIALDAGEEYTTGATIDTENNLIYYTFSNIPGVIVKVDIAEVLAYARPSNLTAACASDSSIIINWVDNSEGTNGFVIERKMDGETSWSVLDTVPAGTTSYTNSGLNGMFGYTYRVKYNI